jgi:hypothetical protein
VIGWLGIIPSITTIFKRLLLTNIISLNFLTIFIPKLEIIDWCSIKIDIKYNMQAVSEQFVQKAIAEIDGGVTCEHFH